MATQKIPGRAIKLGTDTAGDVTYFDGVAWQRLPIGEAGEYFTMNLAGTLPQWGSSCTFPGAERGYVCGGFLGKDGGPSIYGSQIQRFSLVTDGNATDIADMISNRRSQSGHSSSTYGYVTGGNTDAANTQVNSIERFPFATDSDSVDWADLTSVNHVNSSAHSSATHGFTYGGENGSSFDIDVIDKFPFASQTNSTDWADCSVSQNGGAGCSSATHGYSCAGTRYGGIPPNVPSGTLINNIDKFPFASQTDGTDIGDITLLRNGCAGVSSCDHGYVIGGVTVGTNPANSAPLWDRTEIDKFSFASDGNSTDHGDLPVESGAGAHHGAGVSGTTHGYHVGGIYSYNVNNHQYAREQIEKFAYASNVTATDVGDLVQVGTTIVDFGMDGSSGHQV